MGGEWHALQEQHPHAGTGEGGSEARTHEAAADDGDVDLGGPLRRC